MSDSLTVTHLGNSPDDYGGIASVIRAYVEADEPGLTINAIATYDSTSRVRTVRRFLGALLHLVTRRRRGLGVVHVHISLRGSFVREGALAVVAGLRRLPVVITLHSGRFPDWSRGHPHLTTLVLRRADRITVLSEATAEYLRALGFTDVERIPNPVAVPHDVAAPGDRPTAVFAGALSARKGVDVLLAAWPEVVRAVPEARLQLFGPLVDAPLDPDVPGVEYGGEQPHDVVQAHLGPAWVGVLPSRFEGLPMFLLEAMAAGCGVVATPVGGIGQLVDTEPATGELVPVGDAPALAAALIRALDPATATARGQAAHAFVRDRFSRERIIARMRGVWLQAASARD
ncbi:MAG TPA: glycosyltransferase family 4 protein [Jatrophihabitans sp.]|jgi:glycosyltransferase involved in cell wall biosynthesis|uniref:glycosyltransferase family 4 protein n=1 Tax=Jatrophihabitans sp. TaxID=1932789 RepID=UPI002E024D7B|nr:glycosyltransferase family 4 protein [Jatrophihabitans sp.]